MLNPDKLKRKEIDPSAASKGTAGVLPRIPDVERALVTLDDAVWAKMQHDYRHGREKGQTTNNRYLDPYFKWMPGYTNVITGWPGHGKSQLFFELLLLRAVFDSKKSAIWPSENLPAQRFFDGLIHTLTGRPTDRSMVGALSLSEYGRAKDFIREHFIVIDPPTGMPYTPAHLLAYFEAAIAKYGVAHCMLDPWNKCDHSALTKMGGIEPYLVHTLGLCTKWSQDTRQCLVLTAHPKRAEENMGYGKTRPVPTGGTISGGQTWENMAHYVGAMHRPYDYVEGDTHAAFYAHKSKDERNVARRGAIGAVSLDGTPPMVPIHWDEISNRYRWGHERWSPLDAPQIAQLWAAPAESAPALFTPTAAAAAVSAQATPDYQPSTLRTAGPTDFDTAGQHPDSLTNWHPNGRPITLPTMPADDDPF
ncbi:MAG: hypothetical protein ACRYFZ_26410 [Janthinobacterium lividum]